MAAASREEIGMGRRYEGGSGVLVKTSFLILLEVT